MKFIYYVDGEKYTTDNYDEIPLDDISSLDESTPAYENLSNEFKFWCLKGDISHRLTGPAVIAGDGIEYFDLNNKRYNNVKDWLEEHPNQTNAFQVEMLLKYS
jgi:hypothetical protein